VASGTDNGHAEAGFAGAISNQELSAQNSTEMDWMLQNVALKFLSLRRCPVPTQSRSRRVAAFWISISAAITITAGRSNFDEKFQAYTYPA